MMLRLFVLLFCASSLLSAHRGHPKILRTHVMVYGMSQDDYVEWGRTGADYESVRKLVKGGKAELVDVNVIASRSGERATLESVREEIYPVKYSLGQSPDLLNGEIKDVSSSGASMLRPVPLSFETKNVGFSIRAEPIIGEDGLTVDLYASVNFVDSAGYTHWQSFKDQWGRGDLKFPNYVTHRLSNTTVLRFGKFSFNGVFTAKDEKGEFDPTRKLLVFMMVEKIEVFKED